MLQLQMKNGAHTYETSNHLTEECGCKSRGPTHKLSHNCIAALQHTTGGADVTFAWNTMRSKRLQDDAWPLGSRANAYLNGSCLFDADEGL
jgi:hypothetical protein